MKNLKRILCFSLVLLMLLGILIGCKKPQEQPDGSSDESDVSSESEIETDEYGQKVVGDDVPYEELDYNNADILIATRTNDRYKREFGVTNRTDVVDEKVYLRNQKVQEDLGVNLKLVPVSDLDYNNSITKNMTNYVLTAHQSGDPLDIVASMAAYAVLPGIRDCYVDLMGDEATYLSIDMPYWNQSYIDAASMYGQLYYIVGDVNLTVYDRAMVTYVNENLLPSTMTGDQLKQLVLDGGWTFEVMDQLASQFGYNDKDNINGITEGDEFGIVSTYGSEAYDGFMPGFDLYGLLEENDDGSWSYNISGNQKLQSGLELIQGLWGSTYAYAWDQEPVFKAFIEQRALFNVEIIWRDAAQHKQLSNVGFKYSILPMPKYDAEEQDGYYTSPQDAYTSMSIMNHKPERVEMVSAVLDLLCSRSYSDVRPFYIEKIVKTRYVNNAIEVQIMDQILNGIVYETAIIYGNQLGMPAYAAWRFRVMEGGTISKMWASNGQTFEANLEDVTDWYYARAT